MDPPSDIYSSVVSVTTTICPASQKLDIEWELQIVSAVLLFRVTRKSRSKGVMDAPGTTRRKPRTPDVR